MSMSTTMCFHCFSNSFFRGYQNKKEFLCFHKDTHFKLCNLYSRIINYFKEDKSSFQATLTATELK